MIQAPNPEDFYLSKLFPEHNGIHAPLAKQAAILDAIGSGQLRGGGGVYQGGKGSGKTLIGGAATIWVHHQWPGTTSLIGRESYPALLTSTADEFLSMVRRMPDRCIKNLTKPSKNSMGVVEWAPPINGKTLLCSLSNSDVWESANLGFAWVDEAHRQNERICGDLETRLRQQEGPRCILYTTNPGGRGWLFNKANPVGSAARLARGGAFPWLWVEASTLENPTLPPDYHERMVRRYGMDTPAYKRWVKGMSTALEGSVFTEFDDKPEHLVHVVPVIELPRDWARGRGLDFGLVNPTAAVWGAFDPEGSLWIDRVHYEPSTPEKRQFWTIERHAEAILDYDEVFEPTIFPADPSIFAKIHQSEATGAHYSTADKFWENGVQLYPGNNDRQAGLQALLDLVAIDLDRTHPVSLKAGSPRFFVLDRQENEPLIREFMALQWARQEGTAEAGRPDDCQKKDDHAYDATRYLVMDSPLVLDSGRREAYGEEEREQQIVGSRGRTRRY